MGDGQLDFDEFIELITTRPEFSETVDHTDELIEAFKQLDQDGSGYLDKQEFKDMLIPMGLSEREYEAVFEGADTDGDGKISIAEFIHHLTDTPLDKISDNEKIIEIQENAKLKIPAKENRNRFTIHRT